MAIGLFEAVKVASQIRRRRPSHALKALPTRERNLRVAKRVDKVTSEIFVPEQIDIFWQFIYKRQMIWEKRVKEGLSPPWTDDPILQKARFTNVYRELDPGTQYLREHILEAEAPDRDKIFNVMIYRLIGRKSTYQALGFQNLVQFDREEFVRRMKHIRTVGKGPVFSSAYIVSGYGGMGSHDKIENIGNLFDRLRSKFEELYSRILEARTAERVYQELRKMYGFGIFLAFQILVDLTYPIRRRNESSIVPFSNDEWAIAGPGARRGIYMLIREGTKVNELDLMQWLRANQRQEFLRLGIDFPYLENHEGSRIEISLSNIENCLCEFHKYEKIRQANGRGRRRFIPLYSESLRQWVSDSYLKVDPNDFNTK